MIVVRVVTHSLRHDHTISVMASSSHGWEGWGDTPQSEHETYSTHPYEMHGEYHMVDLEGNEWTDSDTQSAVAQAELDDAIIQSHLAMAA